MDLALNNLQGLICHKTQTTNRANRRVFAYPQSVCVYLKYFCVSDFRTLFKNRQCNILTSITRQRRHLYFHFFPAQPIKWFQTDCLSESNGDKVNNKGRISDRVLGWIGFKKSKEKFVCILFFYILIFIITVCVVTNLAKMARLLPVRLLDKAREHWRISYVLLVDIRAISCETVIKQNARSAHGRNA